MIVGIDHCVAYGDKPRPTPCVVDRWQFTTACQPLHYLLMYVNYKTIPHLPSPWIGTVQ